MFQLINITIHKHPIFGYADINFSDREANLAHPTGSLISVIIGRNGIGKSYLLRAIVEIFRTIDALIHRDEDIKIPNLDYRFGVKYYLDGHEYAITDIHAGLTPVGRNVGHTFLFKVDNQNATWQDIRLPQRIIASSMTIADKFPTPSVGIYKYRGVRSERTPSTTGTRTIVRKAVDGIVDSLAHKHTTREEISIILSELGFQSHLEIRYRFRYKGVFLRSDINPELLNDIYTNWRNYFQGRTGEVWGTKYYNALSNDPDKVELVCSFLSRCASNEEVARNNLLVYNVFDENNTLVDDSEVIRLLSNLDILTFPEFKVYKKGNEEGYDFVESSSGETQQLCQFISIMSSIESDSLILIDEPENSSHPNWQMSYIGWLQKIFKNYRDCHFLIATHSHFLLTDMQPEWGRIIALDKEGNGLKNIVDEGMNTFCWSTDDILYRVFGVCNTRNRAFETDIMTLYKMMSEASDDLLTIQRLIEKLSSFELPGNDPLLVILNQARKYVEVKKTI